jgi:hypothetical protein
MTLERLKKIIGISLTTLCLLLGVVCLILFLIDAFHPIFWRTFEGGGWARLLTPWADFGIALGGFVGGGILSGISASFFEVRVLRQSGLDQVIVSNVQADTPEQTQQNDNSYQAIVTVLPGVLPVAENSLTGEAKLPEKKYTLEERYQNAIQKFSDLIKTVKSLDNTNNRIVAKLIEKLKKFEEEVKQYNCPIGLTVMEVPVLATDGQHYEQEYLDKLFSGKNTITSPITKQELKKQEVIINYAQKATILKFIERLESAVTKAELNIAALQEKLDGEEVPLLDAASATSYGV